MERDHGAATRRADEALEVKSDETGLRDEAASGVASAVIPRDRARKHLDGILAERSEVFRKLAR